MAADPQLIETTRSFARIIAIYASIAVLIGGSIAIVLGLVVRRLGNKAEQMGKSFRDKRERRKK